MQGGFLPRGEAGSLWLSMHMVVVYKECRAAFPMHARPHFPFTLGGVYNEKPSSINTPSLDAKDLTKDSY